MRSPFMKYVLKSASMVAMTSALTCGAVAYGQASDQAEDERPNAVDVLTQQTVFVTATKKSTAQNVQDTNISIVALGADQLDAFQTRNLGDLSFRIPNVQLDDIGTVKGTANFAVRGLGVNSSIPSIDPAVGVFIDGVYLGINTGVVFDNFDIDAVEVLRGPQGVLFGRNVTGGAVLVNTGNPTDEFTFKAKAAAESGFVGTGGNYFVQGVVSGPIANTGLKAKLAAYYNNDRGFFENLFDPELGAALGISDEDIEENNLDESNFGLAETFIIRGALEYDGIEGLNLLAKVEYGDTDGDGPAAQSSFNGSGAASFATNALFTFPFPIDPDNADLTFPDGLNLASPEALAALSQTFDPSTLDFAVNNRGFQESDWIHASFRTDYDVAFGNGTITNIFGYREFSQIASSDIDASIAAVFDILVGIEQDQISNEIRYNGRFFDDRLDFTTGFFYFNQDLTYVEQRRVAGGALVIDGAGVQDTETFGIFAAGEFDITDRLSFNAGLRWSDETKNADIALIVSRGGDSCSLPGVGLEGDIVCPLDEFPTFSTSNFSPKIGVGYEFADNFRAYAHWARSFRAGGFNLRNTIDPGDEDNIASFIETPGPFEDERIDNFEIGFKSEPVEGVRLNAAAFFNLIDDIQREINVAGGPALVTQIITNAGDVQVFGLEIDAQWAVTDSLVFNFAVGLVESNFTELNVNLLAASPEEISDTLGNVILPAPEALDLRLPRLAPFTANVGFTYIQDIGFGDIVLNGNYSHRDESFFTDNNLGVIPAQDRVDLSLAYNVPDTGLSVTLYGRNLTNDVILGGDTQLSNGTFSPLGKGRIFGIEFNYEY